MGFGLVFVGYLFMYSFPYRGFDITPDIIGFLIAYYGLKKLKDYGCFFDNLYLYMRVLIPVSFLTFVFQLFTLLGFDLAFLSVWNSAYSVFLFVYTLFLLISIYKIAEDTEIGTIKLKAKRNMFIGVVYYVLVFFFELPFRVVFKINEYLTTRFAFGTVLFLVGYIWLFLNLALIFNCYMRICEPGDEDMPEKPKKNIFNKEDE